MRDRVDLVNSYDLHNPLESHVPLLTNAPFFIIIIHFLTLSLPFSGIFFSILTLPFVIFFNLNIGYWFFMTYGGDWSWALYLLVLCGIWVFSFPGKKDVGFFLFGGMNVF